MSVDIASRQRLLFWAGLPAVQLLVAAVIGMLAAVGVVSNYGIGVRPAPATSVNGFGRFEPIRLPFGSRRLSDIKSFVVRMNGADDYGRVFVNNYLLLDTENPAAIFYNIFNTDSEKAKLKQFVDTYSVSRNVYMVGDKDARVFLKEGLNTVVFEVENSLWGTCAGEMDLTVNGQELETFPRSVPDALYVEKEVVNSTLLHDFESAGDALNDVLCSRRIFEFWLY